MARQAKKSRYAFSSQGPRLIEDNGIDQVGLLKRQSAAHQDAILCPQRGGDSGNQLSHFLMDGLYSSTGIVCTQLIQKS